MPAAPAQPGGLRPHFGQINGPRKISPTAATEQLAAEEAGDKERATGGGMSQALESDDTAEPGQRSGRGAGSLLVHLAKDASRKTAARKPIERARYCVLVVDDNAAARYSVARNLRAGGFATVEAATGVEALQLVASASALVLDVHLPDIDGMEVCRLIRANPATADTPLVHMSARHQDPEDSLESSVAGADAFLKAPVQPDQLLSVIDDLLGRRQGGGDSA